jgi:F0F1-type ATP synthase assembly protein I
MKEEKKIGSTLRDTAPFLTLGIQLAITVIAFFFAGKYADDYFGTKPWLMIGGVLVGSVGGLIKFFRTVIELSSNEEHKQGGNT